METNSINKFLFDIVDDVVLVDNNSTDETLAVARKIGVEHFKEVLNTVSLEYNSDDFIFDNQMLC